MNLPSGLSRSARCPQGVREHHEDQRDQPAGQAPDRERRAGVELVVERLVPVPDPAPGHPKPQAVDESPTEAQTGADAFAQ